MSKPISKRFLTYTRQKIQELLDRVFHLDFFVDVTQEEYDALSEKAKNNGNLYLIHEEDEEV